MASSQPKLYQIEEFTDFLANARDGDVPAFNTSSDVFDAVSSAGVYGQNFEQASDDAESATSSLIFQEKLKMTTATLPIGTYRIGYSYEWRHTGTSNDFIGQVTINDITEMSRLNMEPKDTNSWYLASGFYYHTLGASAPIAIDIDYSTESVSATSFIRRARLEIIRVA